MITNYYNIPNIPCSERLKITSDVGIDTLKCSGLNPDNVFGTLFPDKDDPTINYDIKSSKKITVGNLIGNVTEKDPKQCAQDCSESSNCVYFTVEKGPNKCMLYRSKEITKNDKFEELEKKNNLYTWRKNDLLDGTKNCNIEDGFISQSTGYFPNVENSNAALKINTQQDLSKNECLSSCLYDDNCNSVVFVESKSSCAKMGGTTYTSANNALNNPNSVNPNASTYLKKNEIVANRFGISDNMMDYYKTYSSSGKVGDSFCEFLEDKCMTSYIVGPNNQKEVPSTNSKNISNIPPPKLCMPPNCVPKLPDTGLKGKLKVDASFNIMCPPGNGPDAKECIKSIDKTPFATFDQMGLPTSNDGSNPPNGYLPYTMEYDTYNNLEIIVPASGFTNSGEVCDVKPMNEGEKPSLGSMEFPEDCQNWCNKSVDCGGYSYYFGSDGKAKCNYYDNVGMKGLKDALKPKKDTHTFIKRGNRYIHKPLQKEIKKPYFNNLASEENDIVIRKRVCIQEGFTSKYQNLREGFDDKNDPLINYEVYESKSSNVGNQIGDITKKNEKQCAQDCSNNNDCTYFVSGKLKNYCHTFREKNMVKNDNFGGGFNNYYNFKAWSKNDLSDDKFIFKENYFPENITNSSLNIYETNSNDECFSHCLSDNNCNSIVYYEAKNDQSLCKMMKSNRSDFSNNLENNNDRDYKISSYLKKDDVKKDDLKKMDLKKNYLKKEEMTGNQYGINDDKYCPFPYNKTPASDTNKIEKEDNNGSNCPTPLVKCDDTRYGCCPDNETAKINLAGSNCPIISKELCLKSKYGCCPGTIIPMNYLCSEEDDMCNLTNCELNNNEIGDPYAFYGGKGIKCKDNSTCSSGQMCVDGFCKFYNKKYYNGLNGVKMAGLQTESGNSMNDLLCGCTNSERNTGCDGNKYEPVCGVDGKTYRSRCVAEKSGIKVEHYGTCGDYILEKFYSLDDFKMPVKKSRTSYWILSLLLLILIGSILYCFR